MIVSEQMVEDSLHLLINTADDYAHAKAQVTYCSEMRKSLKALEMQAAQRDGAKSAAIQEREAYASERYQAHLKALFDAVHAQELISAKRSHAQLTIDIWRTQQATARAGL